MIPKQYNQIEGKDFHQLKIELEKVFDEHYREFCRDYAPDYDGENFDEMVELFAKDDFYHDHYVAQKYLELKEKS